MVRDRNRRKSHNIREKLTNIGSDLTLHKSQHSTAKARHISSEDTIVHVIRSQPQSKPLKFGQL